MQISEDQVNKALRFLKESKEEKGSKEGRSVSKKLRSDDPETKVAHDKAKDEIEKLPDVRQSRIKKIKKALESSQYEVTEGEVAKKMLGRAISDKIE